MRQTTKQKAEQCNKLAFNIEVLRIMRGTTPERCATAMGVSVSTFYRKRSNPQDFTFGDLQALANLWNTTVPHLLEGGV